MNTTTNQAAVAVPAIVPVVGMGATICGYSDRMACTIIAVSKSGRTITIQRDTATLLNGVDSKAEDALEFSPGGFVGHTSGTQRYEYKRDEKGSTYRASIRKDGKWRLASCTSRVLLDMRDEHYDFNF